MSTTTATSCSWPTRTAPAGTRRRSPRARRWSSRRSLVGRIGPYQLQAAIAAVHATAPTAEATDWTEIDALYGVLAADRPLAGRRAQPGGRGGDGRRPGAPAWRCVDDLDRRGELAGFHLLHSARADLLRRLGRAEEAAAAYERALGLVGTGPEERFLRRRLAEVAERDLNAAADPVPRARPTLTFASALATAECRIRGHERRGRGARRQPAPAGRHSSEVGEEDSRAASKAAGASCCVQ